MLYKVGNKNKNKLRSAKRFRNNHRQCSTDKALTIIISETFC